MSEPGARPAPGAAQQAAVPEGLVPAVVHLVNTGPVLLGAYTIAELTAVDAVVDFLEARPSDEVVAEAVRSLAARQLLVPGPGDQVQMVLDARVTGTRPGEPWRVLLLPQPEKICLQYRSPDPDFHSVSRHPRAWAVGVRPRWSCRAESGGSPSAG
ncbi:MAG TPA: hypothetical protein VGF32_10915 [Streptosporangiaceae bacterium]